MKIDLEELSTLSERSIAWQRIKAEVKQRGYWKNKARRIPHKSELERFKDNRFVPSSMHDKDTQQVNDFSDGFSEGL